MTTSGSPLVALDHVQKSFGHVAVLKDVNLEINAGEVVVLLGPSGAGKSTLLRTLNQLEAIDGGAIRFRDELLGYEMVRGRPVRLSDQKKTEQRRHFGMVFQQFNLFPHMTAEQNILYAPTVVRGLTRTHARALARQLMARVGLEGREGAYPSELSGGQQQRVAIARSLAMEPDVLLFDEPTSALDPELVDEVLSVMRDLAESGQTMVIVTHEMGFARDVADRVVFMAEGAIVEDLPATEFFSTARQGRAGSFLARFSGASS